MELNQVIAGEFTEVSKDWPQDFVDLTVTSPPYGKCRNYKGYVFDAPKIIERLFYITKPGGVIVWVVNDEVTDGNESGESFEQALLFKMLGFKLHDTMIYLKNTSSFPARRDGNRYTQIFEYMFVFSKGSPKTANLICDKENRWKGWVNWGKNTHRNKDGELIQTKDIKPVPDYSPRNNVWLYDVGAGFGQKDTLAYKHPATMPLNLAIDHIKTWSNPNDLVLDCMCGSGTSLVGAKLLKRKYLGVDISDEYCTISRERLLQANPDIYDTECNVLEEKYKEKLIKQGQILKVLSPEAREVLGFPKEYKKEK